MSKIKNGYWRVSEVIAKYAGLENVPRRILDAAAEKGTAVHNVIDGVMQGFFPAEIPDNIAPYIRSFEQWYTQYNHTVFSQPQRFYSDKLCLTGAVDGILSNGKTTLIDFKTSAQESASWPLQGNAYVLLAQESGLRIDRIIFVHLQKNGEPAIEREFLIHPESFLKILDAHKSVYGQHPPIRTDRV